MRNLSWEITIILHIENYLRWIQTLLNLEEYQKYGSNMTQNFKVWVTFNGKMDNLYQRTFSEQWIAYIQTGMQKRNNLNRPKQGWKGAIRAGIHTCVPCKFWIINKRLRQLSYLSNFSFKHFQIWGLNVFFKHSKSTLMSWGALALW
jgi:hypothetical protein